jgi:hypothetical protein
MSATEAKNFLDKITQLFLSNPIFKLNEKNMEILKKIDIEFRMDYFHVALGRTHPLLMKVSSVNHISIVCNKTDFEIILKIANFFVLIKNVDFNLKIGNIRSNQFYFASNDENKKILKEEAIELLFADYLRVYPCSTILQVLVPDKNYLKSVIIVENFEKNEEKNIEKSICKILNKKFNILKKKFNLNFNFINLKEYFEIIIENKVDCGLYQTGDKIFFSLENNNKSSFVEKFYSQFENNKKQEDDNKSAGKLISIDTGK